MRDNKDIKVGGMRDKEDEGRMMRYTEEGFMRVKKGGGRGSEGQGGFMEDE